MVRNGTARSKGVKNNLEKTDKQRHVVQRDELHHAVQNWHSLSVHLSADHAPRNVSYYLHHLQTQTPTDTASVRLNRYRGAGYKSPCFTADLLFSIGRTVRHRP